MKKTWAGINEAMNRNKLKSKPITALRRLDCHEITRNPTEFPNVLNDFFSSVGQNLAAKVPNSNHHFSEYITNIKPLHSRSFFFKPVTTLEIENEISFLSPNKAYGPYSCPVRALKCAKGIISLPLAEIMNMFIPTGIYPSKLNMRK